MKNNFEAISLLLQAFKFAAQKHQHQRRKNQMAVPYINHLIAVADILWEIGDVRDITIIAAGILHDTLEDTETSPDELGQVFGPKILSIVEEVTDDKRQPKQVRKQLQIERAGGASLEARQVKLADKICNVLDLRQDPPVGWSLERQINYVNWAEDVINGLRGSNERLETYFDAVCQHVRNHLLKAESEEE